MVANDLPRAGAARRLAAEAFAVLAQRFPARARTQILPLDVVAFGAGGVVVVDVLFNRMPRVLFRHCLSLNGGG